MRYLSVCSGIEAASVAWHPLGWEPVAFAEVEPFPSAVLAHHYPDVPNLGDMTRYEEWPDATFDVLVGGTPCQSFSVAGKRGGMDDPRGQLAYAFAGIAARYRPEWIVWENVPGVLSSAGGQDFSGFVRGLAELGYQCAWRVLDAQHFGVPQRRRRLFLIGNSGGWQRAAAVLFERESMLGNTPPSRKARQVAPTIPARSTGGGGLGTDCDCDVGVISMAHGQGGAEIGFDRGPTLTCNHEAPIVAHSLRGEGFDASEDGPGRGTPLVPVGVTIHGTDPTVQKVASYDDVAQCLRARTPGNIDNSSTTVVQQPVHAFDARQSDVVQYGDMTGPLDTDGHSVAIAFSGKDYGGDATADLSPTLRSMGHDGSHANGGGQVAVAIPIISDADRADSSAQTPSPDAEGRIRLRDPGLGIGDDGDPMYTLQATKPHAVAFDTTQITSPANYSNPQPGDPCHPLAAGAHPPAVATSMQVRRLTPVECERLQGFPDGYTAIPWRNKSASECPDGPRYKALGNSMAVPVMRWIGQRIDKLMEVTR